MLLLTFTGVCRVAGFAAPPHRFYGRDTLPAGGDSLRFPLIDRRGDFLQFRPNNPFDLKRPSLITDSIAYDPETKRYYIYEKIGRSWFRKPTWMTFDEMLEYKSRQQEIDYFQRRLNTTLNLNRKIQVRVRRM